MMTDTKEIKHTPLPWIWEHNEEEQTLTIWAGTAIEERHNGIYQSAGEMQIYDCIYGDGDKSEDEFFANVEHIVHCVNAHDELVRALKDIHAWMDFRGYTHEPEAIKAQEALQKWEGK